MLDMVFSDSGGNNSIYKPWFSVFLGTEVLTRNIKVRLANNLSSYRSRLFPVRDRLSTPDEYLW
ncbi:hypothetical protein TPY_0509 [Sulfobacillus acidophilus TPY]|nr:hypothetical protein TPY_0509 [Sulfobacillus acidophilus TPY]